MAGRGATNRTTGKATPLGVSKSHLAGDKKGSPGKNPGAKGSRSDRFEPKGQRTKSKGRGR
jgi:hypothetical protein